MAKKKAAKKATKRTTKVKKPAKKKAAPVTDTSVPSDQPATAEQPTQ